VVPKKPASKSFIYRDKRLIRWRRSPQPCQDHTYDFIANEGSNVKTAGDYNVNVVLRLIVPELA